MSSSVLVVDADPAIREMVVEALRDDGYLAVEAEDGAEAFAIITENPALHSLVLLDLEMQETDGRWFARRLREAGISLSIVVVSGSVTARVWATEIGASAHLMKPFDLKNLLDIVERLCPLNEAIAIGDRATVMAGFLPSTDLRPAHFDPN